MCDFTLNTHIICSKEMKPKGQVAPREASTYYADLALLLISVLWMMLLDKRSLFMLVQLQCLLSEPIYHGTNFVTRIR